MKKVLFFSMLLIFTITANAQVSVIVNKSVTESANAAKVVNIFSLTQTKWADGAKIVVFDNSSDTKSTFYSKIGKDQLSLKKEWMKKQLTGEAKAPESLGSDEDVIKKVASTPGSIGFIKSSKISGEVKLLIELK